MAFLPAYAILYYHGKQVRFSGSKLQQRPDDLGISQEGVEGWMSTPEAKVTLTERASGNGAHDVSDDNILYASRTVTLHFLGLGDNHEQILAALNKINAANGTMVKLRCVDGTQDTYVTGYAAVSVDATWKEHTQTGTLTIVCPRPERLSTAPLQTFLYPNGLGEGGLRYGDGGKGLVYPLDFGVDTSVQNTVLLVNNGTATAYPEITANGYLGNVLVTFGSKALQYDSPVNSVPVIFDSRSQTATLGGVDTSRSLSRRDFPTVPPHSSISLKLMSTGSGWLSVKMHDTYI